VKQDRQGQRLAVRTVGAVTVEQGQQRDDVIERVVVPVRLAVGAHQVLQHGAGKRRIAARPRNETVPASLHLAERIHARALRTFPIPRKSAEAASEGYVPAAPSRACARTSDGARPNRRRKARLK
jgi:hypothetical protein